MGAARFATAVALTPKGRVFGSLHATPLRAAERAKVHQSHGTHLSHVLEQLAHIMLRRPTRLRLQLRPFAVVDPPPVRHLVPFLLLLLLLRQATPPLPNGLGTPRQGGTRAHGLLAHAVRLPCSCTCRCRLAAARVTCVGAGAVIAAAVVPVVVRAAWTMPMAVAVCAGVPAAAETEAGGVCSHGQVLVVLVVA